MRCVIMYIVHCISHRQCSTAWYEVRRTFMFIGRLIRYPRVLLRSCSFNVAQDYLWDRSAEPGPRANERSPMTTMPVSVWTADLSFPCPPAHPCSSQSCPEAKFLLSLLCSLPRTNGVRVKQSRGEERGRHRLVAFMHE